MKLLFNYIKRKFIGLVWVILKSLSTSKRYAKWNFKTESEFLRRLKNEYTLDKTLYDSLKVSIIMPVYNRSYCIENAIKSVLNQSHNNWTLNIIDDGSTDYLQRTIEKYLTDSRIYLYQQEKKGVSAARNLGLSKAKGKYIFYLDSDNTWYPLFLQNMIVYMEKGKLDACYSGIRLVDDNKTIIGYFGQSFNWKKCWEFNYIDMNGFGHHRKFIGKGFRFDESLKRLVDWDFILAITSYSRTAYAPFLGVEYYNGQQGNRITFTDFKEDEFQRVVLKIQSKYVGIRDAKNSQGIDIRPHCKSILK